MIQRLSKHIVDQTISKLKYLPETLLPSRLQADLALCIRLFSFETQKEDLENEFFYTFKFKLKKLVFYLAKLGKQSKQPVAH